VSARLLPGDALDVLRTLDAESVDALVTDPPAGIGFMGKGWDGDKGGRTQWVAWLAEIAREALRVLKPGAHGLVWALPRTSHWTATALEDAGFEIRDVGVHLFGTGFPKSLDVSKAIDKAVGAVRPVIGLHPSPRATMGKTAALGDGWQASPVLTAPSTDAAKKWDGWGTALKPASEHWILVRKPLGSTVAECVLKHGTGALNIDGCRIAGAFESGWSKSGSRESGNVAMSGKNYARDASPDNPQGRWPANLTMDAEAAALLDEQSGESGGGSFSKSGGRNLNGESRSFGDFDQSIKNAPDNYGDSGGASRFFATFKQENECPLCGSANGAAKTSVQSASGGDSAGNPAAGQSTEQAAIRDLWAPSTSATQGALKTPSVQPTRKTPPIGSASSPAPLHAKPSPTSSPARSADARAQIGTTMTTASRSSSDGYAENAISGTTRASAEDGAGLPGDGTRFLYTAKPARSERDIGCDGLPAASGFEATGCASEAGRNNPRAGAGRNGGARNIHPTVKPVDLMRWLCRLVTPKGGLVLDPFMGSGTTGVACMREGFQFIGIEREAQYMEIARRRIVGDAPLLNRAEVL